MTMHLRVLSWNVLYRDRSSRMEALCASIRTVAPDVLMLQESSPQHAADVAAATGLRVAAEPDVPSTDATSMPVLLANRPLEHARVIPLPNPHGDRHYFAVSAELPTERGPLQLCSTHLAHTDQAGRMGVDPAYRLAAHGIVSGSTGNPTADLPDDLRDSVATRLAQVAALDDDLMTSAPEAAARILCGDMNFIPNGPEHATLLRLGWTDGWQAAPRLGSGATILDRNPLISDGRDAYARLVAATQPGAASGADYTLDFHLVRGGVRVNDAWTVGDPGGTGAAWPSDHLGIVMDYDV